MFMANYVARATLDAVSIHGNLHTKRHELPETDIGMQNLQSVYFDAILRYDR